MNKIFATLIAMATLFSACQETALQYPTTRKDNTVDSYFGHEVRDPYRWLENDTSAETAAWVKAQNEVTFGYLNELVGREEIRQRLTELWNFARKSAPSMRGGRYFYASNDGLQNQYVYYMMDSLGGEAKVVLDPNKLSENGTVALSTFIPSPDGKYLGYGISRSGSDWSEYFVRDLNTLQDLPDHLEWIKFSSIAWYKNGFFYSRYPKPAPGSELTSRNTNQAIYYHELGTAQSDDKLIYSDPEHPDFDFMAQVSDDDKLLFIYAFESTSGNQLYVVDLATKKLQKVVSDFEHDNWVLGNNGNTLYISTNNGASRYRIVAVDLAKPTEWKDIIRETADAIDEASFANGRFFVQYMHNAQALLCTFDEQGEDEKIVPLPSIGGVSGFEPNKDSDEMFFQFSSFTCPSTIYKYNVSQNTLEEAKDFSAKLDFDFDNYVTEQIFFSSADSTLVPMFVTHKKGLKLDGTAPAWIYGYGGFNIPMTPSFNSSRLLWLERGGVYVVINMRGGGEYGEDWHKAGTKMNKINVFDDFIAGTQYLIDNGYTSADRTVCQGGSNGGLLIGAVINRAPELYRVAFPQVGVMDMLRYQEFTCGRGWAVDYGMSSDSREMFQYLLSYSPLHNITDRNYPATMVMTADHDDRVVPAHSFKYAATLQAEYKGTRPMLIRIATDAGHGAGKPTTKQIDEWVDMYSFALSNISQK